RDSEWRKNAIITHERPFQRRPKTTCESGAAWLFPKNHRRRQGKSPQKPPRDLGSKPSKCTHRSTPSCHTHASQPLVFDPGGGLHQSLRLQTPPSYPYASCVSASGRIFDHSAKPADI